MAQRDDDLKLLVDLVGELQKHEVDSDNEFRHTLADGHLRNFRDMLDRMQRWRIRELSTKQRSYAKSIYEKLFDVPQYDNAWSAGTVKRGDYNKTAVPAVLQKPLPLKPPGR